MLPSIADLMCCGAYVDISHNMINPLIVISEFLLYSHALESYTAIPYNERSPQPGNPKERPAYQGSNPISDIWSKQALRVIAKYFKRYIYILYKPVACLGHCSFPYIDLCLMLMTQKHDRLCI